MRQTQPRHVVESDELPYGVRLAEGRLPQSENNAVRAELARRAAARRREDERFRRGILDYQGAVNARLIALAETRDEPRPVGPLLTPSELDAMGEAFDRDVTPTDFVIQIEVARSEARALAESVVLCAECQKPLNDGAPLECHHCGAPICSACAIVVSHGEGFRAMAKSHADEFLMDAGLV